MSWTTPTTRATGELITASDWNTDINANLNWLFGPPAARISASSNQAIATGSDVVVTLGTTLEDTDSMVGTNRLTVQTAGIYHFLGKVQIGSIASAYVAELGLRLNGTSFLGYVTYPVPAGGVAFFQVSAVAGMTVANYVELTIHHDHGSDVTCEASATYGNPQLSAFRVSTY